MAQQKDQPTRERIGDWAYTKIRDAILDGELKPGTRLSIPDLAGRLDISRRPARESILRLLSEGLAKEIPHRGAFVADISVDDLVDLYAFRSVLEGLAARLAADHVTAKAERALKKAVDVHREVLDGGDRSQIAEADMAFHRLLYGMSGNPPLHDSLMRLQNMVRLGMRSTMLVSGSPVQALSEHEEILTAVLAENPEEAAAKARSHIDRLHSALRTQQV